jgi:hypothetical protein
MTGDSKINRLIKHAILMCALMFGSIMLHAQYLSDYETIKSTTEAEVIYKGSCTFEDLLRVPAFNFQKQSEDYRPDPAKIAALSEKLSNYHLVILLGTWCEDSHRLIPQLYRVLTTTNFPLDQLSIFALDRDKKGREEVEVRYKVSNVPTIIVLKEDEEIGRITEIVQKSIESDLADIIK